jgi:hypothetical protein
VMRQSIERQLLVEARFLIFLIAGLAFLWVCGAYALWAAGLGTVGAVLPLRGDRSQAKPKIEDFPEKTWVTGTERRRSRCQGHPRV